MLCIRSPCTWVLLQCQGLGALVSEANQGVHALAVCASCSAAGRGCAGATIHHQPVCIEEEEGLMQQLLPGGLLQGARTVALAAVQGRPRRARCRRCHRRQRQQPAGSGSRPAA